ncbi:hypothetical protein EYF80_011459 [Liparis tanakae]|uniref:Uncharacterized protein n=1 Tax=Liparis tanakae TaxID=230148 RepID=A0A4Z2IJR2_9TELE|nr:hypothetical protein EYF80_011459 [Liparis tanakae]
MAQKNFFSLNGFSDAGTGDNRGSSLAWASHCSTSFLACAMLAVLLLAMAAVVAHLLIRLLRAHLNPDDLIIN